MTTIFVVGAGAGYDFGMPMGGDLVEEIASLLANFDRGDMAYREGPFWDSIQIWLHANQRKLDGEIQSALGRLARAIHFAKSIDTLINDAENDLVRDFGKIAISTVLAKSERQVPFLFETGYRLDALSDVRSSSKGPVVEIDTFKSQKVRVSANGEGHQSRSFSQTWFTSFFRELRSGLTVQEFRTRLADTTIINFNYDRLLEYFLLLAVRQYDGVSFETAQNWLSDLNHIHPYGVLADVPRFAGDKTVSGVPVGMIEKGMVAQAPSHIRTFDESGDSGQRRAISWAIDQANRIVLLGYGYHRQNNDLLGLYDISNKKVWGTGLGLSEEKRAFIVEELTEGEFGLSHGVEARVEGLDCRNLIDEFGGDFFDQ